MATLDDRGLITDKLPDVLAKLRVSITSSFDDLNINNESIEFDGSSVFGRLISPIAESFVFLEEVIQDVHSNLDIFTASGSKLEDLCALSGVTRKDAEPAEAMLMIYGLNGITLPEGSQVSSKVTNDVFNTLSEITINNTNCNGVEFSLPNIGTTHQVVINWLLDSNQNTNVPIIVNIQSTESTQSALVNVVNSINSTTNKLLASVTGDYVKLIITDQNDTGSFNITNGLPVNYYKPVDSESAITGLNPQDRNTITNILSSTIGWLGVNNPFDAIEGTTKQNDEQLRKSYIYGKFSDGNSQHQNMYSSIYNIRGVRYVDITDNKLSVEVNGIPPNSFAVTVLGGDPDLISQAIVNNKPLGINSHGDTTGYGFDFNGNPVEVKFSRPSLVPIQVSMSLSVTNKFPDNGVALIRQSLIDHISTFNVGDDVIYSRLFTPINTVIGHSINNLKVSRIGDVPVSSNITLAYNELATISYADITFGG